MRRAGRSEIKQRGSRIYNRTPVTTYYRADNPTSGQSPFQKKLPKRNRRRYLFGAADIILIIFLFAVLVYSLLLSGNPKVTASDSSYHSNNEYERLIKDDFRGLASRNKITFNDRKVINRVEAEFPEVSAAGIELPFFSEQPHVRLTVSPPAFKLKSQGVTYIVDRQGVAVTKSANRPGFAKLITVDDQSGFTAQTGKPVLSSQAAGFIDSVIRQSQRAHVPLSWLTLPAVPLELDLKTADQPYFVKFYLNGDANTETGQFLAARQKFAQNHITPTQYLDVRIAGKIFYK